MPLSRQQMDEAEHLHLRAVGWCLKQRRLARHLTQDQLAALAHVSRSVVQHAEHGRHAMGEGVKYRLCTGLGITIIELDAEVARVESDWRQHGPASNEVPGLKYER
jgi:transcriptional regulator with XRE-family HTH domain